MAQKRKTSDAGNSDMPKRSRNVLPLSEKMKVLDLIRKEKKSYAEVAKMYEKNESSIREIVKKEKEIRASFAIAPQTAKVTATVRNKCLVKMEKALNLWVEDMNRKCVSIDGNMLRQKALRLYEDFSKGSPEMSDTKPFTASKGWLHRFRNRFGLKTIKIIGEDKSACEEAATTFPGELKKLIKEELEELVQSPTEEEEDEEEIEAEPAMWKFETLRQVSVQSSGAGNSDMPKRNRNVLPLSEKVKVLDLIRKEKKSYAEVAKIYRKNESSIREIVKKEKEIRASFAIAPQTAKVTATARDKCLVKMEKALNLWVEDMNRKCVPTDGNMLRQKALSLYEDFSKESPGMSDTKPFTASKGWLHRFRNRFGLKTRKNTGEAASADEEAASTIPGEMKKLIKEELQEFKSSTEEDEAEPAMWTLQKLDEVFRIAQTLKDKVMEYDPRMERSIKVNCMITKGLQPLQQHFDELNRNRQQLPMTMLFQKVLAKNPSAIEDLQPSSSLDDPGSPKADDLPPVVSSEGQK
ncbi:uncharacterized protein LOC108935128 [Scleropages formosus]|uniref:uncharacterized protein LOC108935128 n=1 Tax=Scleropages formosus TaxID=113540 RepID=UPI0010FA9D0F|nr:uncharacterized protein LOC108935128 [Scleropages formosus]XP_018608962.2 uncharacterized protein LOC108935128 [Scleropages formosus]